MIKVKIRIDDTDDLPRLNRAAKDMPFDIDLVSGWYITDAKSMLGLFSLNLAEPIRVDIYADKKQAAPFLDEIRDMIVE